ncbi:hypothetical protein LPMP_333110 [Leishmania panamensis]|uniref:Uncharacterized protein n=1 Tax=Leishmania panamensis TaxID=5679 RepID=A0A088S073_LEIPA|nr:hypothetical protein LPMP_333110 [Leishmania panamensis]AIO01601.1 hypothetical protein LPMP_333110 [Leishmania panamensis]
MQMQGNVHPQQMEWLMQQQQQQQQHPQCISQPFAPRAYHLEPMNALQQRQQCGGAQGMMVGQQAGGSVAGGGLPAYGPGPMVRDMQNGYMNPLPAGAARSGAYGTHGVPGNNPMGHGVAGYAAGMGGTGTSQNGNPHNFTAGFAGDTSGWNTINFNSIFNNVVDPQVQRAVAAQDDGKPLLFPPGHLLAQYPPEYQQQLVFYYRLLRLQYPELYQQYVDYYQMYYEPLYYPAPVPPPKDDLRVKEPQKQQLPPPQISMPPHQPVSPQPVYYPPPVEQPKPQSNLPRTASNLSGGQTLQSSLRRQNSMRRNEVNQLKNEGGLKRLPSMRQR